MQGPWGIPAPGALIVIVVTRPPCLRVRGRPAAVTIRIGELARDADRAATALAFAVAEAERLRVLLLEIAEGPEPIDAATLEILERTRTAR